MVCTCEKPGVVTRSKARLRCSTCDEKLANTPIGNTEREELITDRVREIQAELENRRTSLAWDNQGLETPRLRRTTTQNNLTTEIRREKEEGSEEESEEEVDEEQIREFERRIRENMDRDNENMRGFRSLKLRTPQFAGKKTENVKNFISKFLKYAEHQEIQDDHMVEALGLCMEADALEFFDTFLRNNERAGFEEVKEALVTRFDDERIRLVMRAKINKRKLKENESVTDFFNDIRKMADKIDLDDETVLFSFINGLSPSAAEIIVCQNPTSALEAFQLAKNVEQLKSLHNNEADKISLQSIKSEINNKVASANASSDSFRSLKQEINEIKTMINECLKKAERSNHTIPNMATSQQTSQPWQVGPPNQSFPHQQQGRFSQNRQRNYVNNTPRFTGGYRQQRPWYNEQNGNMTDWRSSNYQQNQQRSQPSNWRHNTRQYESQHMNRNNNNNNNADRTSNTNIRQGIENQKTPGANIAQTHNNTKSSSAIYKTKTPVSNEMTVTTKISESTFEALLDTGSAISLIGEDAVKRLANIPKPTTSRFEKIIAVNSSETRVKGAIRLKLNIMNTIITWDFHIIEAMSSNVILGRDFINANIKSINVEAKEIEIKDANGDACAVTLSKAEEGPPREASAITSKLIIIRPGQTNSVRITPSNDILHPKLDFVENDWLRKKGLEVLTRVVPGETSTMEIRMRNTSHTVIRIYPGRKIGTLTWHKTPKVSSTSSSLKEIVHKLPERPNEAEEIEKLRKFLNSRRQVFAADMEELGEAKSIQHEIKLTEDKIIRSRYYRTDPITQSKIDKHIQTLLDNKIIQPSLSKYASPCLVVDKKTPGETRFVTDYRLLNKYTQLDPQPIPLIQDILDGLGKAKYFSCIDLMAGYMQVKLHPDSAKYSAFVTKNGLFEYRRLPFGLKNSMATFQRLLNYTLKGLIYKTCFCYVDDICTFSNTMDEHIERLAEIFDRLEQEGLKIRYDKCHWFQESITFVGFNVSKDGLSPDPKKVEVVRNYPTPKSAKQVKSFLGLMSYFRRLIKDYSKISYPLNELLRKNVTFKWTEQCQIAFDTLRNKLISAPILAFPDYSKQFIVTTDSSQHGLGFMLSQKDASGLERPIAFGGKAVNKHQQAYPIYQLEMLALITGIEHFEQYLTVKPFIVFTDNTALIWLLKQHVSKGRVSRWIMKLASYDFEIFHKQGVQNLVADALSRLPNLPQSCTAAIQERNPEMMKIKQREDPEIKEIIEYFEKGEASNKKVAMKIAQNFTLDKDEVLWFVYKGAKGHENPMKLVIPDSMRKEVMTNFHDCATSGHAGFFKTYGKIQERFWWTRMYFDIKRFVESCEVCATMKAKSGNQKAPLQISEVENVFDRIQMDFTGPYIRCKITNNAYILVITECLTGYVIACPVPEASAKYAAEKLFEQVICVFGWIKTIQTDLGSHFCSNMMKAFYELIEAKQIKSSAYCPRTNGKVEKMNGILVGMLTRIVKDRSNEWDTFVKPITLAYNSSKHTTHGATPFSLIFGRRCRMPGEYLDYEPPILEKQEDREIINRIAQNIHTAQKTAKEIMISEKTRIKENYDKKNKTKMVEYKVGDKVLIKDGRRHKRKDPKFNKNFIGPFTITEKTGPVTYKINTKDKRITDKVHVDRMKKWVDRTQSTRSEPDTPPPERHDSPRGNVHRKDDQGDLKLNHTPTRFPQTKTDQTKETNGGNTGHTPRESDINANNTLCVINHRRKRNGLVYLVKRKGDPESTARWVNAEDTRYRKLIEQYNKRNEGCNNNITKSSMAKPNTNMEHPKIMTKIPPLLIIIVLLFMISHIAEAQGSSNNVDIGEVYDCSKIRNVRLFATPKINECQHNILNTKTEIFKATVQQYRRITTNINLYYCDATKYTKTCSEDFFGHDEKTLAEHSVGVTAKECSSAVRSKMTKYGPIKRSNTHMWLSTGMEMYKCTWLRHSSREYTIFRVRQFTGQIVGEETTLRQEITESNCKVNELSCTPTEQPLGVLIWLRSKHDKNVYHNLGKFEVHKFGNFILISALGISGAVVAQANQRYLLDNTYIISKTGHRKVEKNQKSFTNFTKNYAKHSRSNLGREILTAKITREFMREDKAMSYLAAFVCQLKSQVEELQEHQIQAFPDTTDRLMTRRKGQTIRRMGDAFMLGECKAIKNYNISWNHEVDGKCFQQPPITLKGGNRKFLEIHTRKILNSSPRIDCGKVNNNTYVRDIKGHYWHYARNKGFSRVQIHIEKPTKHDTRLPPTDKLDERIFINEQTYPHRSTWLDIMAIHQDNMQDLLDLRTRGKGNFITGLAETMSDIVEDVTDMGENIFTLVATGSVDIANDTVTAVSSVGKFVSNLFDLSGGPSVLILYVINIIIIVYLIWMRMQGNTRLPLIKYEVSHADRGSYYTDETNKSHIGWTSCVDRARDVQNQRHESRRRTSSL